MDTHHYTLLPYQRHRPTDGETITSAIYGHLAIYGGAAVDGATTYRRIADALISLHWLRVSERITFKVATLTYHGSTLLGVVGIRPVKKLNGGVLA